MRDSAFVAAAVTLLTGCQLEQKGPLLSLTWSQLDAAIEYHGDGSLPGVPDPMDPDGDGLRGAEDDCPEWAEDFDGYRDLDGCPDTDNDLDGLPDPLDRCPDDAEWMRASDDRDGCPDAEYDGRCAVKTPPDESCNGEDDDCDGQVDEGFSVGNECGGGGLGQCRRTGTVLCSGNAMEAICVGASPGPRVETCNGVDDDCDGVVDNACEQ